MISSKNAEEVDAIMDIQFMEDFFKRYYEDPVSEICEDGEEYNKLCQKICQDIGCFTAGLHELAGEAETNCAETGECRGCGGFYRRISGNKRCLGHAPGC